MVDDDDSVCIGDLPSGASAMVMILLPSYNCIENIDLIRSALTVGQCNGDGWYV